ncbi:L-threonylcarbamoyladenylate synthase [Bacillus piscicola]|uniref:L-threonylcarbamoyladenylate synthase n=1 Tax=Bacillus piscicola TaxID=1632684 RepID=UPI001F089C0E|nr:L-threonylcarbamoyladenylate synthase [Bacillus piscicola]
MSYQQTEVWCVDKEDNQLTSHPDIQQAGLWIKKGEVIAFPTETVYGLGGDATNEEAVKKIFQAKGRPADNPLIVHIGERAQWHDLAADIPEMARQLADAFWPGALTLIVPKKPSVSNLVTAGLDSVAVRMPDHPVARALITAAGVPVAAPSANRSGRPSPTKAEHVRRDLDGRIAGIVDGGASGYGLESTVVDCTGDEAWILRPGGITKEEIEDILGKEKVRLPGGAPADAKVTPKAPGMKYRHYAPDAPVYLLTDNSTENERQMNEAKRQGSTIAVLASEERRDEFSRCADVFLSLGSGSRLEEVSASLYDTLRRADESGVDIIFCETFSREGLGLAIMNRLEKAAART